MPVLEIAYLLWKQMERCCVYKNIPVICHSSQLNPLRTLTFWIPKTNFNIVLPSTLSSLHGLFAVHFMSEVQNYKDQPISAVHSLVLANYHSGDQIRKIEMDGTCGTLRERRGSYTVLVGKPEVRVPLRRHVLLCAAVTIK
jgi:hypothetical protein